ncbi:MAG TPA: DUF4260 domain-containing protein [Roseiarcus sp.]|nr:DUF4260 domain-containing protein [Roseiarcus sp.]
MNTSAASAPRALAPEARSGSAPGAVAGRVAVLLRLEGLAVFAAALAAFSQIGASWLEFAALFLVPDLAMAAYLAGPRLGASVYNLAHTYVAPLALGAAGAALGSLGVAAIALVWIAHIGFDRALGFGLKYATGFGDSHLGRIGRAAS